MNEQLNQFIENVKAGKLEGFRYEDATTWRLDAISSPSVSSLTHIPTRKTTWTPIEGNAAVLLCQDIRRALTAMGIGTSLVTLRDGPGYLELHRIQEEDETFSSDLDGHLAAINYAIEQSPSIPAGDGS